MTHADRALLYEPTRLLGNNRLGSTVVYNGIAHYDVQTRLKGSAAGRPSNVANGFNMRFDPLHPFRGIHESMVIERGPIEHIRKLMLATHIMSQAGGSNASIYYDVSDIVIPLSGAAAASDIGLFGMARYSKEYFAGQDSETGTLFNHELLYNPNGTRDGNPESKKLNFPYNHTNGRYDFVDWNGDKESPRWGLQIRSNRDQDDYSSILAMGAALGNLTGAPLLAAMEDIVDVNQMARTWALNALLGTDDIYTQLYEHNWRLYQRPSDGRLIGLPWDLDRAFRLTTSTPLIGGNNLANFLSIPSVERLLHGHALDILNTTFNTDYLYDWASHYASITGIDFTPPLTYVQNRSNYALSVIPPIIPFEITTNGGNPLTVSNTTVNIQGKGWVNVQDIFIQGASTALDVTWLNGTDWSVDIPVSPGVNNITLEAYTFQGSYIDDDSIVITNQSMTLLPEASVLTVSELMYHPVDPSAAESLAGFTDDDDFEFIELVNQTPFLIDCSGLIITDAIEFVVPTNTLLNAHQHLILVRNKAAFEYRYGTNLPALVIGNYSGKLSNDRESIAILNNLGITLHAFEYQDSWAPRSDGKNSSLQTLLPTSSYTNSSNWQASHSVGGDPGYNSISNPQAVLINEVLYHTDLPFSDSIELYNSNPSLKDLSQWYLSDDSTLPFKYAIASNTTIAANGFVVFDEDDFNPTPLSPQSNHFALSAANGDDVLLIDNSSTNPAIARFVDHMTLGPSRSGVSYGRWEDGHSYQTFLASRTLGSSNSGPLTPQLMISEVMYHPSNDTHRVLEFIEIYNPSSNSISLANASLSDGAQFSFAASTEIPAGGILVVVPFNPSTEPLFKTAFTTRYPTAQTATLLGPYSGQLNNAGENILLNLPDSPPAEAPGYYPQIAEDAVEYLPHAPWPVSANGAGESLHRIQPATWGLSPLSWLALAPTPGQYGPSSINTFKQWAGTLAIHVPLSARDLLSDPNLNGLSNLEEYAHGIDNGISTNITPIRIQLINDFINLQYLSRTNVTDIALTLEESENEGLDWIDSGILFGAQAPNETGPLPNTQWINYQSFNSVTNIPKSNAWYRIKIEYTP